MFRTRCVWAGNMIIPHSTFTFHRITSSIWLWFPVTGGSFWGPEKGLYLSSHEKCSALVWWWLLSAPFAPDSPWQWEQYLTSISHVEPRWNFTFLHFKPSLLTAGESLLNVKHFDVWESLNGLTLCRCTIFSPAHQHKHCLCEAKPFVEMWCCGIGLVKVHKCVRHHPFWIHLKLTKIPLWLCLL